MLGAVHMFIVAQQMGKTDHQRAFRELAHFQGTSPQGAYESSPSLAMQLAYLAIGGLSDALKGCFYISIQI